MVMRYYGNKDKLFTAATDFDLRLPDLKEVPAGGTWAERSSSTRFWSAGNTTRGLMILLRTGVTKNEGAAERMRDIFAAQLGRSRRPPMRRFPPRPPCAQGSSPRQALGMALCRYILRLPPVVSIGSRGGPESTGSAPPSALSRGTGVIVG